jgi:hypothetical protein
MVAAIVYQVVELRVLWLARLHTLRTRQAAMLLATMASLQVTAQDIAAILLEQILCDLFAIARLVDQANVNESNMLMQIRKISFVKIFLMVKTCAAVLIQQHSVRMTLNIVPALVIVPLELWLAKSQ